MNPTAEQLTRAAELAPRVAEIVGFRSSLAGEVQVPAGQYLAPLDPRAFQAVALALPEDVYNQAAERAAYHPDSPPGLLPFTRWLLTPAGMLAFYEALIESCRPISFDNAGCRPLDLDRGNPRLHQV